jgi:hypothetical protein
MNRHQSQTSTAIVIKPDPIIHFRHSILCVHTGQYTNRYFFTVEEISSPSSQQQQQPAGGVSPYF